MNLDNKDCEKNIYELIFGEYKKLSFTRAEAAKLLNRSVKTLDNMRESGIGPGYQKHDTPGGKGAVLYPIHEIVEYILKENYKTAS